MCAEKSEKMQKHKEKSDKNIANIRKWYRVYKPSYFTSSACTSA